MKILFITVPVNTPVATQYPSLGIAYISAYLKQYSHHQTALCDMPLGEAPLAKIKQTKPDIIGLTFNTMGATRAAKIADKIKQHYPTYP